MKCDKGKGKRDGRIGSSFCRKRMLEWRKSYGVIIKEGYVY